MMGMGQCYFVVLSPTGYQVIVEPLVQGWIKKDPDAPLCEILCIAQTACFRAWSDSDAPGPSVVLSKKITHLPN